MSADPPRNFTLTMEERIRAITIGVPSWSARKRYIEDLEERFVGLLLEAAEKMKPMEAVAQDFDLKKLNELVATHNRYFPIEANLPMSQDGYLVSGRVWKPEEPYTPERLVALARARR